jgi:hypothetical protein
MATKVRVLLGALVGLVTVGALATPAMASGVATETGSAIVGPQPVATVTGVDVTVTFLSTTGQDGQPRIGLRELGRTAEAASSPVPGLVAQGLTSLEIYLALAPQGAAAPDALVRVQAAEASQLGRDAAVRTVRAQRAESDGMSTLSLDSCKNLIRPSSWTGIHGAWDKSGASYSSGYQIKYMGANSGYQTGRKVALAACNESSTSHLTASYGYHQRWNNLGWQSGDTVDVPVGGYAAWYWQWGVWNNGTFFGASYQVNGNSVDGFSLVTAEWHDIPW